MNYTREPIIETVITPREGCKLAVRSSKGNGQEDYFVDAVEVVSFGQALFFRSQERPKAFMLPVSDYEILELKETRMVLKNVTADRNIKIGGGREAPRPPQNQPQQNQQQPQHPPQEAQQQPQDETLTESRPAPAPDRNMDRKRGQRRGRRGRDRGPDHPRPEQQNQQPRSEEAAPDQPSQQEGEEPKAAPSFISKLFPPPPTLIKETLSRYKQIEPTEDETSIHHEEKMEETIFEHPDTPEKKDEEDDSEE